MIQNERIKQGLLSDLCEETEKSIELISTLPQMNTDLLDFILGLEDTIDLIDALFACPSYSAAQLKKIAQFIRKNWSHDDPLFRRELLEFALEWNITGFFEDCLAIVSDPDANEMLVFVACTYLYELMQISDLPRVKNAFDKVLNEGNYYQNCQTVAAFYLFRLTLSPEYFNYLKESMPLNGGVNKSVLKNLLEENYNQAPYFAYYQEMQTWVSEPEFPEVGS